MADRRRSPAKRAPRSAAATQAAAEGVDAYDGTVEFMGEKFGLAEDIGVVPLVHLLVAGRSGLDANGYEGLLAIWDVLGDCLNQDRPQEERDDPANPGQKIMVDTGPSEWERFDAHAIKTKAKGDDLNACVKRIFEALSARPTRRLDNSSDGPPPTLESLRASSPATVTRRQALPKD